MLRERFPDGSERLDGEACQQQDTDGAIRGVSEGVGVNLSESVGVNVNVNVNVGESKSKSESTPERAKTRGMDRRCIRDPTSMATPVAMTTAMARIV
mmetsp:Transcript_23908/g.56330  ORF Transcript_23908/g.56330 Transcript_23908/m.56330 type:complete len:97 (-) Transcript_23908:1083-1373(-)